MSPKTTKTRKKTKSTPEGESFNFETALAQIHEKVSTMEQGDLSLEQSLQTFEEGIRLIRHCQQALQSAEQKVQLLLEQHGQGELVPYSDEHSP